MLVSYLVISDAELVEVVHEFEYLVVVDLAQGRWVIEEQHLHLRGHQLLLLVVFANHTERFFHLYHLLVSHTHKCAQA